MLPLFTPLFLLVFEHALNLIEPFSLVGKAQEIKNSFICSVPDRIARSTS